MSDNNGSDNNGRVTIPPGFLVALSTKVEPPPIYEKQEIEAPSVSPDGSEMERWETTKTIQNREEFDEATSVRLKVRNLVTQVCVRTSFGLVCPAKDEAELEAALAEARGITQAFNESATTYQVKWASLRGRIAESEQEAIQAISQEISGLMAEMDAALNSGDVKRLRSLAAQASKMEELIGEDPADEGRDALSRAVKAYRRTARAIVKRVQKEGERLEDVLHEQNLKPVDEARFLFDAIATETAPQVTEPAEEDPDSPQLILMEEEEENP